MISFWRIFWLEFLSLWRSRTVLLLTLVSVGWILAFPSLVHSDGTAEGAWRLTVQYSLGGVFTLLIVALLASAAGSVARERAAKRLQLTLVRPVSRVSVALGRIFAHVAVGAAVLATACAILLCRSDAGRRCNHVLSPLLPSPREEARTMYDEYMKDPKTPDAVRKAKKEVVVRLLTQKALDRYETIPTNATLTWKFNLSSPQTPNLKPQTPNLKPQTSNLKPQTPNLSVRLRFTNPMEMRQDVRGIFRLGEMSAAVSNITQAILEVPLAGGGAVPSGTAELSFENRGTSALMLRPRRDLNVLVPADAFGWNLLRAFLGMVAVLSLVLSFGVFLSCAFARPVALFVAFVVLIVGEMSPSVLEQYSDALETNPADRIGLAITRFATEVTRPVSSLQPLTALAADECVEQRTVAKTVLADFVLFPLVFSLLSALVLPRKQDDLV